MPRFPIAAILVLLAVLPILSACDKGELTKQEQWASSSLFWRG